MQLHLSGSMYQLRALHASGDSSMYAHHGMHGAEPEIRVLPRSIAIPLHVSFSVANGVGALLYRSSQMYEAIIASVKSALGSQSVQCLCPWKPPAIAFLSKCLFMPSKFIKFADFRKEYHARLSVIFSDKFPVLICRATTFRFCNNVRQIFTCIFIKAFFAVFFYPFICFFILIFIIYTKSNSSQEFLSNQQIQLVYQDTFA